MTGTYEGLSLPIFGEFYRYRSDQTTQVLYVENDGTFNLTVANTTDSMDNPFHLTYTTSGTTSSGYSGAFYVALNVGGTSSGAFTSQQQHAFATDVTINGTHTGGVGGFYVYLSEGTATLDSAQIYGFYADMQEVGQTDYYSCITLTKANTNMGTVVDAFILCQLQASGTARSLVHMLGTGRPTYFLSHSSSVAGGYLDAVAGVSSDTPVGRIAVLNNAEELFIYLFADS